jgi:hypothetical protein
MDSRFLVPILVVVVLAAGAAAAWFWLRRHRTMSLRSRFGPEYDRALETAGDVRKAEAELEARQRRVARLPIRALSPEDQARFQSAWRDAQALFVDDPGRAVADAHRVVKDVLVARGYPVSDFEQRAADLSVDYPRVVPNYRAACEIAKRCAAGQASTEDLRQAFVYYRELFGELLETPQIKKRMVSR